THDLDVVIEIKLADFNKVCRKFAKRYMIDADMVANALQYSTHFSIIHNKSDLKIDFWILKESSSEKEKFGRRKKVSLFGMPTYIISAEDMVLTKLEWFKRSNNTKHLDDAVGIIRVQAGKLNKAYIMRALEKLGIKRYWNKAVKKAKV
ncbi:MAG: hypothetical protein HYU98_00765, partial [Deltaproteobacteria bacterium]|nr:hypothetical protein [Deltaproteobacteria bacterium]